VILIELAKLVGPDGTAVGVERAAEARAVASALLAAEGLSRAVVGRCSQRLHCCGQPPRTRK